MCKNFKEKGSCKYGDKCLFAHGEHELFKVEAQPSTDLAQQKTEEIEIKASPIKMSGLELSPQKDIEPVFNDLFEDIDSQETEEFVLDSPIKKLLSVPH